jgi:probable F420-dependent oxidoreductase
MSHPRPFRFGVALHGPLDDLTWAETARKVEDLGFSTLVMPDHFNDHQLGPFSALGVAAAVTNELRLGALVFGNDYRHPVVMAKEMATLDVLSDGRMELGLGAGWKKTDYDEAGLVYDRAGTRIDRMAESIQVIRGLFADGAFSFEGDHYQIAGIDGLPKPVQDHPPLLIGGGGKKMLSLAAREADIVGVTANLGSGEIGAEAIADSMAEAYDEKFVWIRDAAGDRFDDIEFTSLTMYTKVTDDQAAAAEAAAPLFNTTAEAMLASPAAMVGSAEQLVDLLQQRRDRWNFSYPILNGEGVIDDFAPVVAALAGT